MTTRVPLILGGATFGAANTLVARIHTLPEAQAVVDLYTRLGQKNIDESRVYGGGSSEEYVGQLDLHGLTVDTKIYPVTPGGFSAANIRTVFQESVKALGPHKIRVYYLHAPDRTEAGKAVPFEETLEAINGLHKAGLIQEFGLSNFFSWEVAEFVGIARAKGWIQPTVYQGLYNAVERAIEPELIPCLRKYGIKFYAYSPLAAGLLSGRALTTESDGTISSAPGSRFQPTSPIGGMVQGRYQALLPIFQQLKEVLNQHGISMSAAAQRWLQHHSALGPNDSVVIGVSKISQLEGTIKDCEGGPLPEDVVQLLDTAASKAVAVAPLNYAAQ
ncbi:Aldo/keto reductase [Athelia psychrophila]|uniref:Aldo/keto reductase n=1 Tax=Athelia psychrophila TaxID=1759441 RepID=A0A166JLL5_9AGAM|nr:Aldo/keto reductase [Fibularhizoctonia sp. CBS 109695]